MCKQELRLILDTDSLRLQLTGKHSLKVDTAGLGSELPRLSTFTNHSTLFNIFHAFDSKRGEETSQATCFPLKTNAVLLLIIKH